MTNYEYHKQEIEKILLENGAFSFAVVNNEVVKCKGENCDKCSFYKINEPCSKLRKDWLNSEYEEPITVETLSRNFHIFCNISRNCSECTLESSSSICKFKWILENYNLTKKGANE